MHADGPQTPDPQSPNPESQVEKMFEYGYRKSNYGPDELVTDAHGKQVSLTNNGSVQAGDPILSVA